MDTISAAHRSKIMARIKGKNTTPEVRVRRAAHALGYRFRLHAGQLPGSPDLVFPALRTAIFVHGCFWHRHQKCRYCYTPKSNVEFWTKKFEGNVARDERAQRELESMGWAVHVVWECQTADLHDLNHRLTACLKR